MTCREHIGNRPADQHLGFGDDGFHAWLQVVDGNDGYAGLDARQGGTQQRDRCVAPAAADADDLDFAQRRGGRCAAGAGIARLDIADQLRQPRESAQIGDDPVGDEGFRAELGAEVVDGAGEVVRSLSSTPPVPGTQLRLTLDPAVQTTADVRELLEPRLFEGIQFRGE